MTEHLLGRHTLVTGGGTGIGLAIAGAMAGAGAEVTITGRRADVLKAAASNHPRLHPQVMDVADESSVVSGIKTAVTERGPVAICIADAGIAEGRGLHKTDLSFWRKVMTTNLDGAFLTIRECMASMHGADWGRVIGVSSIAGVRGLRGAPAYTASTHRLIGLIRGPSEDYHGGPITFNALCPGYVDTPIVERNITAISERAGMSADEALQSMVRADRHKRLIDPAEIAAAALWLCAPRLGKHQWTMYRNRGRTDLKSRALSRETA